MLLPSTGVFDLGYTQSFGAHGLAPLWQPLSRTDWFIEGTFLACRRYSGACSPSPSSYRPLWFCNLSTDSPGGRRLQLGHSLWLDSRFTWWRWHFFGGAITRIAWRNLS